MRTLVIDSATEACSVALFDGNRLLAHDHRMLGRGHAEQLVPMIAALPGKGRAARIAVARGPGSFTGVRVGVAAARALALAWQSDTVGYTTHALMAAMARSETGCGDIGVCSRAGHGEWFCARYDAAGREVLAPVSLSPESAVETLTDDMIVGSEAEALLERRGYGSSLPLWPDARGFALLDAHALGSDISPIYARAPDATPANKDKA